MNVEGESMLPSFLPGDRLLLGPVWRPKTGQVVAVRDPRDPDRLMIKRVGTVGAGRFDVLGDNPSGSTDSRHFGPVARSDISGRVLYRYAPRSRAGWWPK